MVATTAALIAGAAAKVAAGLAAAKAAVAATAIGSKVIAGFTAVKGAIGAVGTAIKATKIGGMVVKGMTALGKTKIGGALVKGAKAVSGFTKAHPVATGVGKFAAQQGVSAVTDAVQQANSVPNTALTLDSDTISKKDLAQQNARTTSYQDAVFGSAMNLSSNTFAGEGGSGIFSGLVKQKRNALT